MEVENRSARHKAVYGVAILCALLVLAWLFSATYSDKAVSIVSAIWADETFKQCSRPPPRAEKPYWKPSHEELNVLEDDLAYLMSQGKEVRMPRNLTQYHRQYVGFTRNGERLIYGNFVPVHVYRRREWSLFEKPILICDGGAAMWGIVYNPKIRRLEAPQFNGG